MQVGSYRKELAAVYELDYGYLLRRSNCTYAV